MKQYTIRVIAFLIGSIFLTHAVAEEYDYDIGVSYGNSTSDLETPLAIIGGDPFGTTATSTDSDALELSGTWYYSGLSDSVGPKSRAAFLSRASSLSLAYSHTDESTLLSSTGLTSPPLPPGLPTSTPWSGRIDDTTRELQAGLRHVWGSTGWYGLAGATSINSTLDGSAYYAGVGKYIGDTTALDFKVSRSEVEGIDATDYALSLTHIGSLGSEWQYAADLEYSQSDAELGNNGQSYLAGLSLFPTDNFEFGVRLTHQEYDFSPGLNAYEGFAGWFVRDDIELRAWYEDNDFDDSPFAEIDSNRFGIGVNVRF